MLSGNTILPVQVQARAAGVVTTHDLVELFGKTALEFVHAARQAA